MPVDRDNLRAALVQSAQDHGPGLFGLVAERGRVVYEDCVGVADLDHPRPIDGRDRFRIGSLTKTYTAAVVLQLCSEQALRLDDPLERWLPGLVPDADGITIEVLLRMRSGLPDYVRPIYGDPPDLSVLDRYWSPEELVAAALGADDRLPADREFRYSNTDYILLGLIVERATGQRVDAQLWQRIVRPLRLEDTTFPIADALVRGHHAKGYLRAAAREPYVDCTTISPSESWTAGAIIASARDVARFLDGLLGGALLDGAWLARMTACEESTDAYRSRGLGIVRYAFDGADVAYGHTGGMPGYCVVAMRTPGGRSVVLWQNGFDAHDQLTSDAPFIRVALSA